MVRSICRFENYFVFRLIIMNNNEYNMNKVAIYLTLYSVYHGFIMYMVSEIEPLISRPMDEQIETV